MMPKKTATKRANTLLFVAILLVLLGLGVVFLSRLPAELALKVAFIGSGVGITSVVVAFLGIWIAQKSNEKISAIANL